MGDGRRGDRLLGDRGRDGVGGVDGQPLIGPGVVDGGGVIALGLDGDVIGARPFALAVDEQDHAKQRQQQPADEDRADLPRGHDGKPVRQRRRS